MEVPPIGVKYPNAAEAALKILGMHCATCSLTVQKALLSAPGVLYASVSLAADEAKIVYDPAKVSYPEILRAVQRAGYDIYREEVAVGLASLSPDDWPAVIRRLSRPGIFRASPDYGARSILVEYNPLELTPKDIEEAIRGAGFEVVWVKRGSLDFDVDARASAIELRDLLARLWVALPLAAAIIALMALPDTPLKALLSFLLATPVQFYSGMRFIKGAYRAFKNLAPNMDSLVALGTLAAYFYSAASLALGRYGQTYFDASAVVIAAVLLGRYIEARMRTRTADAVRRLFSLMPSKARVLKGGAVGEKPAGEVEPGELVEVREGEAVPVDGYIEEGAGSIDVSSFTGEPAPVDAAKGALVLAGMKLISGRIVVRATRSGAHTALAQMAKLVRIAQGARLPVQDIVDKVAGAFTWVVMAAAAATFAAWYLAGAGLATSLLFAVAVLVVACPCALGLATPLAVAVGVGKASEKGVLIKRPEALQKLLKARVIAFDKTGTLTLGRPRVAEVIGGDEVLRLAAVAESKSNHPLGRALVEEAVRRGLKLEEPESFDSFPGQGVVAQIGGSVVAVGNERIVEGMGAPLGKYGATAEGLRRRGYTVSYVVKDGAVVGLIAFGDTARPGVPELIKRLKAAGLATAMLTGDAAPSAEALGKSLGIDEVRAGLTPEDKAKAVEELREKYGPVAYVGDGVNDAVALSSADVGVAVGSGADIAKEAGDIVLLGGGAEKLDEVIKIAKAILNNIKFNLVWAFAFNAVLIPIAAGALVSLGVILKPELAGIAMALSSVIVTLNSFRLRYSK
nr:MAG: ATPase [Thermoproteus sp. AZ2]